MENAAVSTKESKFNIFSNESANFLNSVSSPLFSKSASADEDFVDENVDDEIKPIDETFREKCLSENSMPDFNKFRCNLCLSTFLTLDEQRDHFQSDWHNFNVKRKLKGTPPLKEEEFETFMSENENGSSDSDSEKSSRDENTKVIQQKLKETGQIYFLTSENLVLSCFRCLIVPPCMKEFYDTFLTNTCRNLPKQTNFIILSLAGGHFGGAVFEKNEPIVHKTFSRYTVRAKQGGGQSSADSAQPQNKAKSAGANLRRYNELALCQDIRELLNDWKHHIKRCNLVFIRCSSYHKYIFFGGQNPAFDKSDARLRTIPFNTYRPTFEEIRRIHRRLTIIVSYGKSDEFLSQWTKKVDNHVVKSQPKPKKATAKPTKHVSSSDEELFWSGSDKNTLSPSQHFTVEKLQELKLKEKSKKSAPLTDAKCDEISPVSKDLKQKIYTLCKIGDVEEIKQVLTNDTEVQTSDLIAYLNTPLNSPSSPTYLHLASASGNCNLLRFLLEYGCDPTIKNDDDETPFQVSNGKLIRKEFSKFRDDFPDRWDWNKAQVPLLLQMDPETEALRNARLAEKRRIVRKQKAEKTKGKREEEMQMKREENEKKKFLNLSDREKRALAAERRIVTECSEKNADVPILSRCYKCGNDMTGKIPFEYSEFRFCTVRCLQEHRNSSTNTR